MTAATDLTGARTRLLRLGTRRSTLAMAQSRQVADTVEQALGRPVELVEVSTTGDESSAPLTSFGGVGVFVSRLREALLDGRVDLAVHSLKDLPTAPAEGLVVAAVPERADVRDVLVARDGLQLATLPAGARVGTGSPRRAAQLRAARPDLEIVDLRGNVDTRMARVTGSGRADLDAVVLARAGLLRIGRAEAATEVLEPEVMLPAPGQGALAVECRTGSDLAAALKAVDDPDTRAAVTAERVLLAALEAGCAAPLGALARVDGGRLHLQALLAGIDGRRVLRRSAEGAAADAEAVGLGLAAELLAAGAAELLAAPRSADGTPGVAVPPDSPRPTDRSPDREGAP